MGEKVKLCTEAVILFQNIGANLNLLAKVKVTDKQSAILIAFFCDIASKFVKIFSQKIRGILECLALHCPKTRCICKDTHDCRGVVTIPFLSKHCQRWPNYLRIPFALPTNKAHLQKRPPVIIQICPNVVNVQLLLVKNLRPVETEKYFIAHKHNVHSQFE